MHYTTKIISASTRMHPFVRNNKRLLRYVNRSDFAVTYLLVDLANKRRYADIGIKFSDTSKLRNKANIIFHAITRTVYTIQKCPKIAKEIGKQSYKSKAGNIFEMSTFSRVSIEEKWHRVRYFRSSRVKVRRLYMIQDEKDVCAQRAMCIRRAIAQKEMAWRV